ncbi:hypothetical protein AB0I60_37275 [Actinosynnema sp. NPDC050436]|uniref:hypothetical protein n=1 Tax=Actinosynnema sp. NPDC050436 TaxID=3155659 RepID=UPI0033E3970B
MAFPGRLAELASPYVVEAGDGAEAVDVGALRGLHRTLLQRGRKAWDLADRLSDTGFYHLSTTLLCELAERPDDCVYEAVVAGTGTRSVSWR